MSTILERTGNFRNRYRLEIAIALGIFLIASLSFGLGYLMGRDSERAPIIIEKR